MIPLASRPLLILAILAASSTAQEWPTFRHDIARSGASSEALPTPLVKAWEAAAEQAPVPAWPGPGGRVIERLKLRRRITFDEALGIVIGGERVYFGSSIDNSLHCLDAASGRERWIFTSGGPIRLAPTLYKGRVYFGSDDGLAYCLNATSGKLVWKRRAGPRDERILARGRMISRWPVRTGVLVDGGVAYFGAGSFPHEMVYLYALDARSGKVIWRSDEISLRDAQRSDLTPQGYLLASKDRLFVPSGRTLPAAIERASGRFLFKQLGGGKQVGGSAALLVDDRLYSVGEHNLLALGAKRGRLLEKFAGRQMTLADGVAYIATGGELLAVEIARYGAANRAGTKPAAAAAALRARLAKHPVFARKQAVVKARQALARAEQQRREAARTGGEQARRAEDTWKRCRREARAATRAHASALGDYRTLKEELAQLLGVRWRIPCARDSALILAGDTLVAGGQGEVVAFERASGKRLWSAPVAGSAHVLAAAGGRLLVSTSAGRIYAFAPQGPRAPARATQPPVEPVEPFAVDELSPLYAANAAAILERSGVRRGFCLVLGSAEGRLAYELARRSELVVYGVEKSAARARAARAALLPTGLYGTRITIDHLDPDEGLPYSDYFADLIVSDSLLRDGVVPGDPASIARHLKPCGGVLCLGAGAGASGELRQRAAKSIDAWIARARPRVDGGRLEHEAGWSSLVRGPLPGAASWTHQYGNPGATACVPDQRVRGGLRVLWYGDPGPSLMVNRHAGATCPLSVGGRLFVQGQSSLMAYDAYNGLFLWERADPGALRTGLFMNYEPGNLAAGGDALFAVIGESCLELEAASGKLRRTHHLPPAQRAGERSWGYVAVADGLLVGSATARAPLPPKARGRGRLYLDATDELFAIDLESGRCAWRHQGRSIAHTAIAIAGGRVFFIDSNLTPEQRAELLQRDKSALRELSGAARALAEERIKHLDARRAVALDLHSGEQLWARGVDVTDCTGVGIGAGNLMLMASRGCVVLCGANANGHYWNQFLKGEFKRRRIVTLAASDGNKLWARDANYRHRPLVVGDTIIAEPWAYDLRSGAQRLRVHPLTGEKTPWLFPRPGHHCGGTSASPAMLFFRSGYTAYYDLESDSGTVHFSGHRQGCWINTIPAAGLVLIPEASAGCACLFSLTSTVVFEPCHERQRWGVYGAPGARTPVRHMALNLGAPGDRRDASGKLWLAWPRPSSRRGIDLPLAVHHTFVKGGRFVTRNEESCELPRCAAPWIFASEARGLKTLRLPLIGPGGEPARYTVRLYFQEPAAGRGALPGVKLQGKLRKGRRASSARGRPLEFRAVKVGGDLAIELAPRGNEASAAALCAIEVLRAGAEEILR